MAKKARRDFFDKLGRDMSLPSLSKKSLLAFFAKLLSELQNLILYHYFAILPLRRVIERERTP